MPSTQLIVTTPQGDVKLPKVLNSGAQALFPIAQTLLQFAPHEVDARALVAAIAAEVNRLPDGVDTNSIVRTAFNCACLGLAPGPQLGLAHFVPFKGVVQLIVGYRGFRDLAIGAGFLAGLHCEVVQEGEDFERWVDRDGPQIYHDLSDPNRVEDWAKVVGAYCQWESTAGHVGHAFVGRHGQHGLQGLYDKLHDKRGSVWESNPVAMSKKTPILRAAKTWPTGNRRIAQAVYLEEHAERGERQPALEEFQITPETPPATLSDYETGDTPLADPDMRLRHYRQRIADAKGDPELLDEILDDLEADGEVPYHAGLCAEIKAARKAD
jgi:phage RecT family recombinase